MRTFAQIAREIRKTWPKMSFSARPYVDAMNQIFSSDKNTPYIFETAEGVVLGFLANASTWRGEDARRIKAELNSMIS